jgi:hypothetical protein
MNDTENAARTYTRAEIDTAADTAEYMVNSLSEDGGDIAANVLRGALSHLPARKGAEIASTDVASALNAEANEDQEAEEQACGENSTTIRNNSARDLAVNAALHLLDHPEASLFDVIVASWADLDVDEDDVPEGSERGSDAWNDAIFETVKGWFW